MKELKTWQVNLLAERDALADRLEKLDSILAWSINDPLLFEQSNAMHQYLDVLDKRIAAWDQDGP